MHEFPVADNDPEFAAHQCGILQTPLWQYLDHGPAANQRCSVFFTPPTFGGDWLVSVRWTEHYPTVLLHATTQMLTRAPLAIPLDALHACPLWVVEAYGRAIANWPYAGGEVA